MEQLAVVEGAGEREAGHRADGRLHPGAVEPGRRVNRPAEPEADVGEEIEPGAGVGRAARLQLHPVAQLGRADHGQPPLLADHHSRPSFPCQPQKPPAVARVVVGEVVSGCGTRPPSRPPLKPPRRQVTMAPSMEVAPGTFQASTRPAEIEKGLASGAQVSWACQTRKRAWSSGRKTAPAGWDDQYSARRSTSAVKGPTGAPWSAASTRSEW